MTYKHNLVTNSIELWIDEITSPSAYSRIKEALKQRIGVFPGNTSVLSAPMWATADRSMEILDIFVIWTCSIVLKEIGVDGQKKLHVYT